MHSLRIITVLAIVLSVVIAATSFASRSEEAKSGPFAVHIAKGTLAVQPAAKLLLAKAERFGRVAVIVGLNLRLEDEDRLTPAAAAEQLRRLGRAQEAVIARATVSHRASIKKFELTPHFAAQVSRAELARLLADRTVTSIAEDLVLDPQLVESTKIIKANAVWNQKDILGRGQAIAILDTGVDLDHEALAGRVVSQACYSSNVGSPPASSLCPGGQLQATGPGSGINCPPTVTDCHHGTYVASIAAGGKNPAKGVAPRAKIISIKVVSQYTSAAGCNPLPAPCAKTVVSDLVRGLKRVYKLRNKFAIAAVNLSLSHGQGGADICDEEAFFAVIKDPVDKLRGVGIPVIAAAGNNGVGTLLFPACISNVIAVAATNDADEYWPGSNFSWKVQMLAPGADIDAAVPTGSACITAGEHCTFSGTSAAAPHLAGAFALLREAQSTASIAKMLSSLTCTGKPIARPDLLHPRINVLAAHDDLLATDAAIDHKFDVPADGNPWRQLLGNWSVAGGAFKTLTLHPGWVVASHDFCNPAFTVATTMERIDDDGDGLAGKTGLFLASNLFRRGDQVIGSGYMVTIDNQGTLVERLDNFAFKGGAGLSGGRTTLCLNASVGNPAQPMQIHVIVRGDGVFIVHVESQPICSFRDVVHPPPTKIAVVASGTETFMSDTIKVNRIQVLLHP